MTNLSQRSITYIDLVLKGKWYDLIESGEKKAEYRRLCEFWWKRIFTSSWDWQYNPMGGFDLKHHYVRLRRGYGKDAPSMMFYIGDTAYVHTPPVEVQEELGTDPVIELKLLHRIGIDPK